MIFSINNIHILYFPNRYVAIVVKSYYDKRGGIHYFSENLSSETGATYQGFIPKYMNLNKTFHTPQFVQ